MSRTKYLLTLALVLMFAGLASSALFADFAPWVALSYDTPITVTGPAGTWKVPVPNDFTSPTFSDVDSSFWAWAAIEEDNKAATAHESFIVQGYGDGSFQPAFEVTRGMMAVFIARAAGLTGDVDPDNATFPDVPSSYWAFTEIEQCVASGIVMGYTDGLYRPAGIISRDQLAVFIQRAIGAPTVAGSSPFGDVGDDFWALGSILACVDANIVQGYADGFYRPALTVTRDQMAVFIWRGLVRDTGCVVLGGPGVDDDAVFAPAGGDGAAELFLPDVVTATGASSVNSDGDALSPAPGSVVFVVLDAVQCPSGDITFDVENSTPVSVASDSVSVDAATAEAAVGASGGVPYLVASFQIPADLIADDYTIAITLPNGAVLDGGSFTVE